MNYGCIFILVCIVGSMIFIIHTSFLKNYYLVPSGMSGALSPAAAAVVAPIQESLSSMLPPDPTVAGGSIVIGTLPPILTAPQLQPEGQWSHVKQFIY